MAADSAPTPHLSALREAGGLGFISGHVALVPGSDKPLGDVAEQTRTILTQLQALLHERARGMADIVQVSVYLANPADFSAMNQVYAAFFPTTRPARTTTSVTLVHPELLVEIDAVVDLQGD